MSEKTMTAALEKLAKWRKFFASWQLGTTPAGDGRYRAVADHREVTIVMRAELSALTDLLIAQGVFTQGDFQDSVERHAKLLDHVYEERFPGWRSLPEGLHMKLPEAAETMRTMGFPPCA